MGYYRRRRSRKIEGQVTGGVILILIVVAIVGKAIEWAAALFESLVAFAKTPQGVGIFGVAIGSTIFILIKNAKKAHAAQAAEADRAQDISNRISSVGMPDDRHSFIIEGEDYKRGTTRENTYRRSMKLALLSTYDNCCAKCHADDNGIDLDHFFLSKNEGGNFIMRHKAGYLVNNAIPLCRSCNSAKSDISYIHFFSQEELVEILERNALLTKDLNSRGLLAQDGSVIKKAKKSKTA